MSRNQNTQRGAHQGVIHDYEASRLKGRYSNMDLFKMIQEANTRINDETARTAHCCYIHLIGFVPGLDRNVHNGDFESESIEDRIDETILYQNVTELLGRREEYAVFEDNLGPTLDKLIHNGKEPSLELLKEACSKYEKEAHMAMHDATSLRSYHNFVKKDVETNEALAYAFAISFYTGTYSEALNQNTALLVRSQNRQVATNDSMGKIDEKAAIIMYYLLKGLSHIDFYWGVVTRCVNLTPQELDDYQPGYLITWLQFSSANRGYEAPLWFRERNTIFFIHSLTGRAIKNFSNCAEDEDEVLFLPHSSFVVCHAEEINGKNHIYLRQVELGLCKYVVLWVDDNIFVEWWENKEHMERASTLGTEVNVHFVPKSNTSAALAFLRSEFGQRLKNRETFRIVTDMNRDNETPSGNAGAAFLYQVRELDFDNECLIFTGDIAEGRMKLASTFQSKSTDGIEVSDYTCDLENFVQFK